MRAFFLAVVLLTVSLPAAAQGVDSSCLELWQYVGIDTMLYFQMGYQNPDSVMIDTCSGSPTKGDEFGKGYYQIIFLYNVLPIPPAPHDSVAIVDWTAIDTAYPAVRDSFASIQHNYGNFYLRKNYPDVSDTSSSANNVFEVEFENYVDIDSILNTLRSVPDMDTAGGVDPFFWGYPFIEAGVLNNRQQSGTLKLMVGQANFTFPFSGAVKNTTFSIWNALGQKVYSGTVNNTLETPLGTVPELQNGIYFIEFNSQVFKFPLLH